MRTGVVGATLALIVASGGCASPGATTAANATVMHPLVVGWERFFEIEWHAGERKGQPVVSGSVTNTYGEPAGRVQLLVEGLDDRGVVVTWKVVRLGGDVLPPSARGHFEVPVSGAPTYRVSVFAYDWVRGPSS